ncbi:DUF1565 domain-containing protein [Candidatus Micrarchaeota archaeon]|nr:DUF1565 domain-containing protein [Candidatus Micrarchaeota archaeon]
MRFPISLSALVLYLLFSTVSGAMFYVNIQDLSCDDNGPGSEVLPWCTINEAVHSMQAGDTAYVLPGTYDIASGPYADEEGDITSVNDGTENERIQLIGLSTAADIIGLGNSPEAQDDENQVFIEGGIVFVENDYWTLQGFYVKNRGGIRTNYADFFELKDSLIFVDPSTNDGVHKGGGRGLRLYRSHNAWIDHVEVWSINFDAHRLLGNEELETRSSTLTSLQSNELKLTNSILYGGRNVIDHQKNEENCVIEDSTFMWGQEHIGMLCPYNFRYSRNVWYPTGQQAPYINVECEQDNVSGVFENNHNIGIHMWAQTYCPDTPWYQGATDIVYRNNFIFRVTDDGGACMVSGPEYEMVFNSDYNGCSSWDENDMTQYGGNFWNWWGTDSWWPGIEDWIEENTNAPYSLAEWQVQEDVPQPLQDPNSMFLFDPKLITPYEELGQLENDDYSCYLTFGAGYENAKSNCEPPFRMRVLDDLRLQSDSPLRDAGDPAYGSDFPGGRIDIGAFEFSDGLLTCADQGGDICEEDEECPEDQWIEASDSEFCCAVECEGGGAQLDCILDLGGRCLDNCDYYRTCWEDVEGFCETGVCCMGSCLPTPRPGGSPLMAPVLKSKAIREGAAGYLVAEQVRGVYNQEKAKAEFNFMTWVFIAGAVAVATAWFFFDKRKKVLKRSVRS